MELHFLQYFVAHVEAIAVIPTLRAEVIVILPVVHPVEVVVVLHAVAVVGGD